MKKKQIFTLEVGGEGSVQIKTHLGRYLYGTSSGDVLGDAESASGDTAWTIDPQMDGTWALKSPHGFFLNGTGENLSCFVKELPADGTGKWVVRLAMHPQVNIRNVMRKRYLHQVGEELQCSEPIPWGDDALLTLVFFEEHPDGRYGLLSASKHYLNADGSLTAQASGNCQFLLGFHDNQISFRSQDGLYLSCVGASGKIKVNKDRITKDELFVIHDSEPQFTIQDSRGKFFSSKMAEVKANQPAATDLERFQLEIHADGSGSFKDVNEKYWEVCDDGSVQGKAALGAATHFRITYHNNRVRVQAPSGKFLTVKSNGSVVATGNGSDDEGAFLFTIINRPQLVLRGGYGFLGLKGESGRIEVNKAAPEVFDLEPRDGAYALRAANGKYWTIDADGVAATNAGPTNFYLEFVERSRLLVRTEAGTYLQGEQNGGFKATGRGPSANTLWEF